MSLLAIGVTVPFFLRRSPLRWFVLLGWFLVPIFFLVVGRDYRDHYVFSVAPFFVMPLGLALGDMFRRGRVWAIASAAFLVLWIGAHTDHWVPEYLAGVHRPTLLTQLRRAEAAAQRRVPIQVRSGDPDVFIVWALAKDHFGREPVFYVDELRQPCRIEIGRPSSDASNIRPLRWDSYFTCP
jgi:hypothetical protein